MGGRRGTGRGGTVAASSERREGGEGRDGTGRDGREGTTSGATGRRGCRKRAAGERRRNEGTRGIVVYEEERPPSRF